MSDTAAEGTAVFTLGLRGGRVQVSGTPPRIDLGDLAYTIEQANVRHRLDGLPDALNPDIVDLKKATSFAAGLAGQPGAVLDALAGRDMPLWWEDLGLLAAAPTNAADFAAPFTLTIDEAQGQRVLAHTSVRPDPALARANAAAADAALRQIARPGKWLWRRDDEDADAAKRLHASALARTWLLNARAWVAAEPAQAASRGALAAAEKAVATHLLPRGG